MSDPPGAKPKIEPRWPVVCAILAVLFLLSSLPSRLRVLPAWVPYLLAVAVIVPMLGVSVSRGKTHWIRFEGVSIWIFDSIVVLAILEQLRRLLGAILRPSTDVTGLQLLASSIEVWASNALVFSIIYWRGSIAGAQKPEQAKATLDRTGNFLKKARRMGILTAGAQPSWTTSSWATARLVLLLLLMPSR